MEVGIQIPHTGQLASAAFVPTFCAAAETAGFDGLWTADHLVAPVHTDSVYTLAPAPTPIADGAIARTMGLNLEMNVTLAIAAATTERVTLWTGVSVLPIRNPVLNARQLASIDLYSGGRLRYGAGIGWLREEAEAMGMPWDRRGQRADEHIQLMRALWTAPGDTVEFHGEFYELPPMDPNPKPVQRPIPILIGGHSDAALDRVARIGDGWIATRMSVPRVLDALKRLDRACARHHRDRDQLIVVCGERFVLDPSQRALNEQCDRIVEGLAEYAAIGVHHFKVGMATRNQGETLELLDLYAHDVLPAIS